MTWGSGPGWMAVGWGGQGERHCGLMVSRYALENNILPRLLLLPMYLPPPPPSPPSMPLLLPVPLPPCGPKYQRTPGSDFVADWGLTGV